MRVLVFGDSVTQGYWDTEGGWVDRLRAYYDTIQINDLANNNEPSVFNLGVSADNSANILNRLEAETRARSRHNKPPIVVVQIGVNDSSTNKTSPEESVGLNAAAYQQNLEQIVATTKAIRSKLVFVGLSACDETKTTPTSWGDVWYTNQAIKRYEDIMQNVAKANNVPFIPVFDAFMAALTDGRQLLPDGLHPNNEGHELIFRIVQPKLAPYLTA